MTNRTDVNVALCGSSIMEGTAGANNSSGPRPFIIARLKSLFSNVRVRGIQNTQLAKFDFLPFPNQTLHDATGGSWLLDQITGATNVRPIHTVCRQLVENPGRVMIFSVAGGNDDAAALLPDIVASMRTRYNTLFDMIWNTPDPGTTESFTRIRHPENRFVFQVEGRYIKLGGVVYTDAGRFNRARGLAMAVADQHAQGRLQFRAILDDYMASVITLDPDQVVDNIHTYHNYSAILAAQYLAELPETGSIADNLRWMAQQPLWANQTFPINALAAASTTVCVADADRIATVDDVVASGSVAGLCTIQDAAANVKLSLNVPAGGGVSAPGRFIVGSNKAVVATSGASRAISGKARQHVIYPPDLLGIQ